METRARRTQVAAAVLLGIATVALASNRLDRSSGRSPTPAEIRRAETRGGATRPQTSPELPQVVRSPAANGSEQQASLTSEPPGTEIACVDVRTGIEFSYFAQHLLGGGILDSAWSGAEAHLCLGTTDGLHQVMCSDGAGGSFAGWVDSRHGDPDIYLQHFDANGAIASGWPADGMPVCQATWSQYNLDLTRDGSGGVFLAWQDFRDASTSDIYGQHVLGSGELAPGWPEEGLAICSESHAQSCPRVAADGRGGLYVAWQDGRAGSLALGLQHLGSNGERASGWPVGGAVRAAGTDEAHAPCLASDSTGLAMLVFRTETGSGIAVNAIQVGPDEVPSAPWIPSVHELTSGAGSMGELALAAGAGGGWFVGWSEGRDETRTLRVQRLTATGTADPAWPPGGSVVCMSELGVSAPRLLATADGAVVVAWEDFRDGTCDVYAQRIANSGTIAAGWPENGVAVRASVGEQYAPSLASDGAGGAFITWADAASGAQAGLMGAHAVLAGRVRLLRASSTPGRAVVVWQVPSGLAGFEVHRRVVDGGEWLSIGTPTPDDSSHVVLEDRAAPEGALLEYRLATGGEGFVQFFEPVRVQIPAAPLRLALHRAWAIPAQNTIVLSLALPRGQAPAADLLDVMGRRVQRQTFPGLEPGEQQVRMGIPARLASGVYFIRLTQGSQARTAKVVLIR